MCCHTLPLTRGEQAGKCISSLCFRPSPYADTTSEYIVLERKNPEYHLTASARALTDRLGGIGYYETKVTAISLKNGDFAYYQPPQEGERGGEAHKFEFNIFKVGPTFEPLNRSLHIAMYRVK
jgi:hypothetical protein